MNTVTTGAESTVPETTEHEEPAAQGATVQVEENVGVRVKQISEINGHVTISSSPTGTAKRKLPEWMLTQCAESRTTNVEQNAQAKKMKISGSNDAENVSNNQEAPLADPPVVSTEQIQVKKEPAESTEDNEAVSNNQEASWADSPAVSTEQFQVKKEPALSTEDTEAQPSSSSSANLAPIKPAIKVEIADASSTARESCKFGIGCYRRNQMHRIEEAHPGDQDYKRPSYPLPPLGTPDCPYGDRCYRRNPIHFERYSHPENTDFEQNFRQYSMRLRRRQQNTNNNVASGNSSELDEYDLEDPFIDDSGSEYEPSNEEEETEDFLAGCDDAEE